MWYRRLRIWIRTRSLVIDRGGRVVGSDYREFKQYFPKPSWVEHDATEIWESVLATIAGALAAARVAPEDIAGIGVTNQRETSLVWDRHTGKPIANAIVWQCRRTADLCEGLRERGLERAIRARTGLPIDAYFSGTKLKWLLDHVPGARKGAARGDLLFGTIDTWLAWNLSGGASHVTDPTNASRTLLYNLKKLAWDPEMLALLRVPAACLPTVATASSGRLAETRGRQVLPDGIPVSGIAGDQQAALFGQLGYRRGAVKNTYGTGCFLLLNTGSKPIFSRNGLLSTVACGPRGEPVYALEGSVFIAGAAVQWLRDGLGFFSASPESESLAAQVEDAGGVYVVPAFTGLGAPYWDMYARGAVLGITRGTTRAHVARATLEAIAYQTRDVLAAMEKDAGLRIREVAVDGGASKNELLLQFQADILPARIRRPANPETTSMGAAYLAGLGVGFWKDVRELEALRAGESVFAPRMPARTREKLYAGWKAAVARVLTR
ncbi:MAG: glycerol kinase GlpK [Planctomycetes bacterium]|nr:glycerol kinase GlpK [Planctomycetota bacterium]